MSVNFQFGASLALCAALLSATIAATAADGAPGGWRAGQWALLQALALPLDAKPPPDSSPAEQAQTELGRRLFFDPQLNPERTLACASCHQPSKAFSDGLAHPLNNPDKRNTPGLLGVSHNRWFFWDGRKDSLWSQTLEPIFAAHEIALSPAKLLSQIDSQSTYRELFVAAYGAWPSPLPEAESEVGERLLARVGQAIAAFVATLEHRPAPFDRYVAALKQSDTALARRWMDADAEAGLRVFLRSNCLSCHGGWRFSDGKFHNIGTGGHDPGRARGRQLWRADRYSCLGQVAAALDQRCSPLQGVNTEISSLLSGAFKTPSLRELRHTAPYFHDGRHSDLQQVLQHYQQPPKGRHGLAKMPPISEREAAQLQAFLESLSAKAAADP